VKAVEESPSARRGLTSEEVYRRLSKHGPNELTSARRAANIIQILRLFANPLIIILLIASAVSGFLGERINASIIVVMVFFSVALNFFQTYRSERASERSFARKLKPQHGDSSLCRCENPRINLRESTQAEGEATTGAAN
jgi:magnesium-transporting ATPase (P-type)